MPEAGMNEEQLMQMLMMLQQQGGAPMEEEGGGMLMPALGLGAGAGVYTAMDPFRRALFGQMMSPGEGVGTRGELAKGIGKSVGTRFKEAPFFPLGRSRGIEAGRKEMLKGMPTGKGAAGATKLRKAASASKFGPRLPGKAAATASKGLLKGLGLTTPLGWAMMAWLLYDLGHAGYKSLVSKPRQRSLDFSTLLETMGQGREERAALVEQQSLADQLEGLRRGSEMHPPSPSAELSQVLGAHNLAPLFKAAQPTPPVPFRQAMDMVGGL
jgi:hypothetical protein